LVKPHTFPVHIQNPGGLPHDISISPPEELQGADVPAIPLLRQRVHKFKSLALDTPSQEAWQKIVSRIGARSVRPYPRTVHPHTSIHNFGDCVYPVPQSHLPSACSVDSAFPHFSTIVSLVLLTDHYHINISAVFPLILAATRLQNSAFRVDDEYGESSNPDYTNVISVPQFRSVDVTYPGYGLNLVAT